MSDRLPPQNLEAERAVLGAVMLDPDTLHEVARTVTPEDFYRDSHQTIYRAILNLYSRNIRADAVSVCDELERRGEFRGIGGDEAIMDIANSIPHAANVQYHAAIVRQKSICRQLIQSATEIIRDGYSNLHTADELLEAAERRLFAIAEQRVAGTALDGPALADRFRQNFQRRQNGEIIGTDTLFGGLDSILLGMRPGQYIVVGARPSVGKSAFAQQIAWNASFYQGIPTLFFSLEMSGDELSDRLTSMITMIDSRRFRDMNEIHHLTCEETERLRLADTDIRESRLFIEDTSAQTLMHIAAASRRHRLRNRVGLIVIDYLQYIAEKRLKGENTTDLLDRVSKGIKSLARELNVSIIALAQLNRETEKEQRRPRMSDLRGCGAIEQDADVILLLHSTMSKEDTQGIVEVLVEKNRNGPTGLVSLLFQKPFTRFESMAHAGEIRAEAERPAMPGTNRGYEDEDGNFIAF